MWVKFSKGYSSYSYDSFFNQIFWMFPVTVVTDVASWNLEISNLNLKYI